MILETEKLAPIAPIATSLYSRSSLWEYQDSLGSYKGEHLNKLAHGEGTFHFHDGSSYTGHFALGMRHGMGTYKDQSGASIHGEWVYNAFVTIETHSYPNKEFYQGRCYENNGNVVPHGHGRYQYFDGSTYEGEFLNGRRDGEGIYKKESGEEYVGFWKNDLKHGEGTFRYANPLDDYCQQKYKGNWHHDAQHGFGTLYYGNGEIYRGQFENGLRHGFGTHTDFFGISQTREWAFDSPVQKGRYVTAKNNVYEGQYYISDEGIEVPHGKGIWSCNDKSSYEGDFFHSLRDGQGNYVDSEGNKYEGEWKQNKVHGYGTLFRTNGIHNKGLWNNGNYIN